MNEFFVVQWNIHGASDRDAWWMKSTALKAHRPTVISLSEPWSTKQNLHGYIKFTAVAAETQHRDANR
jgi:hypothetical protein